MIKYPKIMVSAGAAVLTLLAASASYVMAQANTPTVISQKGRAYTPGEVVVGTGGTLVIVNDDFFVHHVFVDHDDMQFDSGSMDEGERTELTFNKSGFYTVGCAIHPKMKLDVTVQ